MNGGTGADVFSFAPGASIGGEVDGGGGADVLDFSQLTTGVTVTEAPAAGNKATSVGSWTRISTVIGSADAANTLVGPAQANVWDISGANSGSLDGSLNFSGFQSLTGGSTADAFEFLPGGSVAGNLKGGAPVNILDYSQYGSPVTVSILDKTATGIGGAWTNLQDFIGSGAGDTLVSNNGSTWTINGSDSGTVGAYSFAAFANLVGGAGNNTFALTSGGAVSGSIDGQGGTNTLDLSGYGVPVTVNLQTNSATGVASFADIQSFKGDDATDTLIGSDAANSWSLKGTNARCSVNGLSFKGFVNLVGGSGTDTFALRSYGQRAMFIQSARSRRHGRRQHASIASGCLTA